MISSVKRKFNSVEISDSTISEHKKSKVSRRCHSSTISEDENVPRNMQKDVQNIPVSSTNNEVVMKQSVDNLDNGTKKQARKGRKRLNLKKTTSQAKATKEAIGNEVETIPCPKKKFQLFKDSCITGNKSKDNENIKGSDMENSGVILECHNSDSSTCIKSCPVCSNDISLMENDTERNHHINKCLDGKKCDASTTQRSLSTITFKELEFCQICERDISTYNTIQRQQHVNRCCDNMEDKGGETKEKQIKCLICDKIFKTIKSRQSHMKRCANKNNVSTVDLVKLNRNENVEQDSRQGSNLDKVSVPKEVDKANNIFEKAKRKKKPKIQNKNADEEIQLALALSASLQPIDNEKDVTKRQKKKQKPNELPALLLRSDNETKKVTAARAAAVLCHWADGDEDIQSTPALAPSTLLKRYGANDTKSSAFLDAISEEFSTGEKVDEGCSHGDVKECKQKQQKQENTPLVKTEEFENCGTDILVRNDADVKNNNEMKYLTVDSHARLWHAASLCSEEVKECTFYVPNLLPKTTPRKQKVAYESSSETNEQIQEPVMEDIPTTSKNYFLTESQETDVKLLAELGEAKASEESISDRVIDDLDITWVPSSGFCVTKHTQIQKESTTVKVEKLVSDLSSMVGSELFSDVKIVARNNQTVFAHSFMLAARCDILAEMLRKKRCFSSENNTTLEMDDVDVRAVHAVMVFLYTASFVPVNRRVMEDIKVLLERLDLDCNVEEWVELNKSANKNNEVIEDLKSDSDAEEGVVGNKNRDLDVLLKSLWEGEEMADTAQVEDAFGDSILDDDLEEMEIKIYTRQITQKNTEESPGKNISQQSNKGNRKRNKTCGEETSVNEISEEQEQTKFETGGYTDLSTTNSLELDMDIKANDISADASGWLVPETPCKSLSYKPFSRDKSQNHRKHVALLEGISQPHKLTVRRRRTSRQLSNENEPHLSQKSTSTCQSSPKERNKMLNSLDHSSYSPELIISPDFPRQSFSITNQGNSFMGTESDGGKDKLLNSEHKLRFNSTRKTNDDVDNLSDVSMTKNSSLLLSSVENNKEDNNDDNQDTDYNHVDTDWYYQDIDPDHQDIVYDHHDNDYQDHQDDNYDQNIKYNNQNTDCNDKDNNYDQYQDIDCNHHDVDNSLSYKPFSPETSQNHRKDVAVLEGISQPHKLTVRRRRTSRQLSNENEPLLSQKSTSTCQSSPKERNKMLNSLDHSSYSPELIISPDFPRQSFSITNQGNSFMGTESDGGKDKLLNSEHKLRFNSTRKTNDDVDNLSDVSMTKNSSLLLSSVENNKEDNNDDNQDTDYNHVDTDWYYQDIDPDHQDIVYDHHDNDYQDHQDDNYDQNIKYNNQNTDCNDKDNNYDQYQDIDCNHHDVDNSLSYKPFSPETSQNHRKDVAVLEGISQPHKLTVRRRRTSRQLSNENEPLLSQKTTSTCQSSPKERNKMLNSLDQSSYSPELIISPDFPRQSFFTTNQGNSFMGTESDGGKDKLLNSEHKLRFNSTRKTNDDVDNLSDVSMTKNSSLLLSSVENNKEDNNDDNQDTDYNHVDTDWYYQDIDPDHQDIVYDHHDNDYQDHQDDNYDQNIKYNNQNTDCNDKDINYDRYQDIDRNHHDVDCDHDDVVYDHQDVDYNNENIDYDIDCYDDGGFNCDIEDYFAKDSDDEELLCNVDEKAEVAQNVDTKQKTKYIKQKTKYIEQNKKDVFKQLVKIHPKTTPVNARLLKKPRNSVTPMLDYSNMATPELTTQVKQYGVRPLPKRKMIIKLKEIYHYTHQEETSSESEHDEKVNETADVKFKPFNKMTKEPAIQSEKEIIQESDETSEAGESAFDQELSDESDVLSQDSSLDLSKQFMNFLEDNRDLYTKILKYEPIPLATVLENLKDRGIKCSTNKLKDFFDEQCITYSELRPTRRRKKRYTKPKSRKNN